MKKIKILLMTLAFALILTPFVIRAEEEEVVDAPPVVEKTKINVYMFRGEGCSYCAAALDFFEGIEEEYGKYFNLVTYETWYDEENAAFMQEVGEYLNTTISGVPFIIVGKETYPGFDVSFGESIKKEIVAEYNLDASARTDYIADFKGGVEKKKDDNTLETVIILAIVVVVAGFIVYARKSSDSNEENKKAVKKQDYKKVKFEDDEEEVVEKKKETKSQSSKTATAKKPKTSKKK